MNPIPRTDLALECSASPEIPHTIRGQHFHITDIHITTDAQSSAIGKPKGHYLTLETSALHRHHPDFPQLAAELGTEFRKFLPENGLLLVAGLGNRSITPDALGVMVGERLFVTRHLHQMQTEDFALFANLREICAIAPGVLGQTGMEAAEQIKAICKTLQPAAVIVVDALACSALERLGTTIQICDSGISPGSGVQNRRAEISRNTLGIPVIAIGVPTVTDLQAAVGNTEIPETMMVTPKDVDALVQNAADLLLCGLHLAFFPELSFEEVVSLL